MVELARKTRALSSLSETSDKDLESIDAIASYGAEIIEALETALAGHDDFVRGSSSSDNYGAFYLVVGYLQSCRVAEEVPSPRLDEKIQRFIASYEKVIPSRFVTRFVAEAEVVRQALRILPEHRLSEIFLGIDHVPWLLLASAPIEEIGEHIVANFNTNIGPDGAWREYGLESTGDAVVPVLRRVLEEQPSDREFVLSQLEKFGAGDD